jgi:2-succinyl-6-hydroxy-2,4-cyclohexadiene-1-carboxylate synthase
MPEVRLHIEVEGSGPTVVLAHGFGGSARNFAPQARALRDRYHVVRYDARGHARSAAPDDASAYTPEVFAADMGRVLDHAGAETAVVGGLSMGAGTALRFALTHRERVRGLVIAAFPPGPATPGSFTAVARAFAESIECDGLDTAGERFVWGPTSGLDPQAAKLVRQGFLEHPPHGLAHTLRGGIAEQPSVAALAPQLAALEVPALVIVGDRDRMSLEPCRALASALPNARLAVIEGAGHVVNLAKPAEFNAELARFLGDL